MRRAPSPLRGRYLTWNPALLAALTTADVALAPLAWARRTPQPLPRPPRRLLLCLGGHLGDAVIATAVLSLVREIWPAAEIGVLLASWARPVIAGHPEIRHVHVLDHWKPNRSAEPVLRKAGRYWGRRGAVLREIRAVGYDAAVDLYPFFPNSAVLIWQAGIPVRVGYTSAGFGALLTHPVRWRLDDQHTAEYHRDLLVRLEPRFGRTGALCYSLPASTPQASAALRPGEYVVLHMGAGLRQKEWPRERWRELAQQLADEGQVVVFTGSGAEQRAEAAWVAEGLARSRNLCDRLDWKGFADVLAGARLAIAVDSVAGHLAAAAGTPVVVITAGINVTEQWRPLGEQVVTLTHPTPCAPCFRSSGCADMACVREISTAEVLAAAHSFLAAHVASEERL